MITKLLFLLLIASVSGIPLDQFFPFNGDRVCLIDAATGLVHTSNVLDCNGKLFTEINSSECEEFRLSPNNDGSSHNISISVTFPFFSKRFQSVYVSEVLYIILGYYS